MITGELVETEEFLDGNESVSYFGVCPTFEPSEVPSSSPSTSYAPSNVPSVSVLPSSVPNVLPSAVPSSSFSPTATPFVRTFPSQVPSLAPSPNVTNPFGCDFSNQDKFELVMNPDNNFDEVYFHVFRLFANLTIDRKVFAENSYSSAAANQTSSQCLYNAFCYKLVVYDRGGDGICCESGQGSYQSYWNGEYE